MSYTNPGRKNRIYDSKGKQVWSKARLFCLLKGRLLPGALAIFFFLSFPAYAFPIPSNLYQAIIGEDTQGNLDTYRIIASVVRNRLQNGLNLGLVAAKRHDLTSFVDKECLYAKRAKNVDLKALAQQAIDEVFNQGQDYANGADHYEHTGYYPIPAWARNMIIVKVLFQGTRQELTCWKRKGDYQCGSR